MPLVSGDVIDVLFGVAQVTLQLKSILPVE